ncbi:uncharacterized protein [Ptychodera flava]|uniref:uncharacterized protein n=1 Tax=Ptychodera flava TaxID=63121 RepID=UPI00396A597A
MSSDNGRRPPKRKHRRKRAPGYPKQETREELLHKLTSSGDRLTAVDEQIRQQLTSQEIRDLMLVFDTFDRDKKGCIDSEDLRRAMRILGFSLTKTEIYDMIADLGSESKGLVTFNEFLEFIVNKQGNARDIYDEIIQGFRMLDREGKGHITFADVRNACDEHGIRFSDVMIQEMLNEADVNGDNVIDKEEFISVMLKTNLF